MTGGGARRRSGEQRTTRPSWLPFGGLLALGEVIVLVLVLVHSGPAVGTSPAIDHLAASAGPSHDVPHQSTSAPVVPTTTVPVSPPTTVAPPPVTPTTVPRAVPTPTTPPRPSVQAVTAPGTLPANIPPQPNFLQSCSGAQYDDSTACVTASLQAIANGRSHEGLPPMVLPSNWTQLSPQQQIFVATNLERTVRGLPPLTAMATSLDQAAGQGAAQNVDPPPPAGFPYTQWGSNWAGAVGNPLEAIYFWMYDDGAGTANIDCTPTNQSGCWGHRENILMRLTCTVCVMGTGWDGTGYSGDPSMTELLVETSGNPSLDFTWRQESPFLS
jgi:hypothetical protein